jgi:hypothetical protein
MPPKISIDAKLEELHTFVSESIALFASRAGDCVRRCLRALDSKVEKYWHTFLTKYEVAFSDVQQQRLEDIYKLISSHRLAEASSDGLCKCPGDAACRSKTHVGTRCTSNARNAAAFKGMCRACAPEQRPHCNCDGDTTCHNQKHHDAGKCKQLAQMASMFG